MIVKYGIYGCEYGFHLLCIALHCLWVVKKSNTAYMLVGNLDNKIPGKISNYESILMSIIRYLFWKTIEDGFCLLILIPHINKNTNK